jgi:hypothetical protein
MNKHVVVASFIRGVPLTVENRLLVPGMAIRIFRFCGRNAGQQGFLGAIRAFLLMK